MAADRQTDTQTCVTTIHFASPTTHEHTYTVQNEKSSGVPNCQSRQENKQALKCLANVAIASDMTHKAVSRQL